MIKGDKVRIISLAYNGIDLGDGLEHIKVGDIATFINYANAHKIISIIEFDYDFEGGWNDEIEGKRNRTYVNTPIIEKIS